MSMMLLMRSRNVLKYVAPLAISAPILVFLNSFLFDPPFKYWVALFEIWLTYSIYLFIYCKIHVDFHLEVGPFTVLGIKEFDLLVISLSFFLFSANLLGLNFFNNVILAVLVTFFLLGYSVLRFLNFQPFATPVEWILLAFFISISINCIFFTLSLIFPSEKRPLVLSFLYFALIFATLFPSRGESLRKKVEGISFSFDLGEVSSLLLCVGFVLLSLAFIYPKMAYLPGIDIARHYSSSILVSLNPNEYSSPYPWFHFQLATVQLFSGRSIGAFQSVVGSLGILLVFAIYLVAKICLVDLDRRIPVLTTVSWTLFSGFGWIRVCSLRENALFRDPLILMGRAFSESFWDVGYGQGPWLWLWFRPFSLGMIGTLLLLYLLRRTDMSSNTFWALSILVSLSSCMVHFPEFVLFVVLLSLVNLLHMKEIRLKDMSHSMIAALLIVLVLSGLYEMLGLKIRIPMTYISVLLVFLISSLALLKFRKILILNRIKSCEKCIPVIFAFVLIAWTVLLFYWIVNANQLSVFTSNFAHAVPLVFYPVLLGVNGLLALYYLLIMTKNRSYPTLIVLFALMLFLSVIYGKLITFAHIHQIHVEYWERRTIAMVFLASSILATKGLLHILTTSPRRAASFLLSIIVFSGASSTVLSVEFQHQSAIRKALSPSELEDLRTLSNLDYFHYLLPTSLRSLYVSEYFPFKWRIKWFRNHVLQAESAELVLNTLFSTGYPAVIYTGERGEIVLRENYSNSYVLLHILNIVPPLDGNVSHLFKLPSQAPPAEDSEVVLLLPENIKPNSDLWYAIDFLSLAGYNYTIALVSDLKKIEDATILIIPSVNLSLLIPEIKDLVELPDYIFVLNLNEGEISDSWIENFEDCSNISVTYLDMSSFVRDLEGGFKSLYYNLSWILAEKLRDFSDLFTNYSFQREPINSGSTAAFRRATIRGNITITFDSIIMKPVSGALRVDEEKINLPENLTSLTMLNYDRAALQADYAEILPGQGFYMRILLSNVTLLFEGSADLIAFLNGSPKPFLEHVDVLNIDRVEVLVRRPLIKGHGEIAFEDFYAYDSLYREIRVLGDDCRIRGIFSFTGAFGDQYSLAKDFSYQGNVYVPMRSFTWDTRLVKELVAYFLPVFIVFSYLLGIKLMEMREGSNDKNDIDRNRWLLL